MTHHRPRSNRPTTHAQRDLRRAIAVLAAGAALIGVISLVQSVFKDPPSQVTAAAPNSQESIVDQSSTTVAGSTANVVDVTNTTVDPAQLTQPSLQDITGDEPTSADPGCTLDKRELRLNDTGAAVTCLQQALIGAGYLSWISHWLVRQRHIQRRQPAAEGQGPVRRRTRRTGDSSGSRRVAR